MKVRTPGDGRQAIHSRIVGDGNATDGDRRGVIRVVATRRAELEAGGTTSAAYAEVLAEARHGAFGPPDAVAGLVHEAFHDVDRRRVFAAARTGGRKIDADGAVAASRLYTPRYIVEFLLQNSLGAWWLEAHPDSSLAGGWPLLVTGALGPGRSPRPLRDLRLLDPCCGCGAFLIPAFAMLTGLYAEERALADAGRIPREWAVPAEDTPGTIVERNLHGADLDAGAVAITADLLRSRAGADAAVNLHVPELPIGSLATANWPNERFDIVCTNPPYVGFRMLDAAVKQAVRAADPMARSDLAVAFQSRCFGLLRDGGLCATVTPAAWLTGRESLPLRDRVLDQGGPRVSAALGQRVFDQAPLLFVGLSVVERGGQPDRIHVLRPPVGSGVEGLRRAVADGAVATDRALLERLPLRPFLPGAPPAVLSLAGRGPRVGDLFSSFDGVWTGSNARDTRYWWELDGNGDGIAWRGLSGGQGNEPWAAPTRLRIRSEHTVGRPGRDGAIEYARVAGGRLAARCAAPGTAALAGIVTLVPRGDEGAARIEEVLAIFNSRIGGAWLRTLTSGLNFNPGYAAEIPLGTHPPPPALSGAVRALVALRSELATGDPTADTFIDTPSPWATDDLRDRIAALEDEVEALLADHLNVDGATMAMLEPVRRSVRGSDPLADHLGVRVLRVMGMRWPDHEVHEARRGRPFVDPDLVVGASATVGQISDRLARLLAVEGVADPGVDVRRWVEQRFLPHHAQRFRQRPIVVEAGPSRFRIDRGRRDPGPVR